MSRKDTRLTGLNSLAYLGVNPQAAPNVTTNTRAPNVHDREFNIGDMWVDTNNLDVWMLVDLRYGQANWNRFATTLNTVIDYVTDVGTATVAGNVINMLGLGITDTVAAGNTVTTSLVNATNGYTYIGDGLTMVAAPITSTGGTITITHPGPNTIDMVNANSASVLGIKDNIGGTATVVGHRINIIGTANIGTSGIGNLIQLTLNSSPTLSGTLTVSPFGAGVVMSSAAGLLSSTNGANGQVIIGGGTGPQWANILPADATILVTNTANNIDLKNNAAEGILTISGNIGTASDIGGNIQILGGANVTTSSAAHTIIVNLDNSLNVDSLSLLSLNAGVVQTNASGVFSSSNGLDGQVLIGGGTNATWNNITSTDGSILITNAANSIDLKQIKVTDLVAQIDAQTGSAVWAAGNINIFGGSNIATVGALHSVTIGMTNNVTLLGTFGSPLLGRGVVTTSGAGLISSSIGSNGYVLIGGGAAPAWAPITSTGGTITITRTANHIDLKDASGGAPVVVDDTTYLAGAFGPPGSGPFTYETFQDMQIQYDGTYPTYYVRFDPGDNITHRPTGGGGQFVYTAPIAGKYNMQAGYNCYRINGPDEMKKLELAIVTSNRTYNSQKTEMIFLDMPPLYKRVLRGAMSLEVCCDFDVGDTLKIYYRIPANYIREDSRGIWASGFYIGA